MSAKKWVRAKLIEVYEKVNPIAKHLDKEIYLNGDDNAYPKTLSNIINESPTAKRCSNLMAKFLFGKGLVEDVAINKNYNLSDLSWDIMTSASTQYGAVVWVGYGIGENGKLEKKQFKVLNYEPFRKQKNDDNDELGKVIFSDWDTKKRNLFGNDEKGGKWYHPFNDDEKVIKSQIESDYGKEISTPDDYKNALKSYRGQVMHINLTPNYHYALPPWDSVYNDMNTEGLISRYINSQTRSGFVGKTAVVTSGLDEDTADAVDKDLKGFLGAENASDIWSIHLEAHVDIEKSILFKQIPSQFDDKLFEKTKKDLRVNISGAFNNPPNELLYSNSKMFGNGAGEFNEMKKFYWEQNEYERQFIVRKLKELGFKAEFKPMHEEKKAEE